jgi:hypothetical protein
LDNEAATLQATAAAAVSPALPTLEECTAAVAVESKAGIRVIAAIEAQCPQLAPILATLGTPIQRYLRHDGVAIKQQKRLKRESTITNLCMLGTGVVSALVVLVAASGQPNTPQPYALVLGIFIIILGAVGTLFNHIARDQGRAGRWLVERGEAELARLEVFREAARKAAEAGPPVAMYGLALLVTHLLNDQRSWMRDRALRHRNSSEVTSVLGGVAVALAFVGGSGAIVASQSNSAVWVVLAGTVGAALAAYAVNREALLGDRANAERYEKAGVALDGLEERVRDIAGRVRSGESQALVAFTDSLADQMSAEHKQWLEGTAQADSALAKLDAQLKQLGADRGRAGQNR